MLLRGTLYVRFCDILTLYCLLSLWTSGDIHLFGHLHQLGGLVPDIYVLSDEGHLELELADWMESRMWGPLSPSCLRFLLALCFRLMWSFCACQLHSWVCRLCFCCRPAATFCNCCFCGFVCDLASCYFMSLADSVTLFNSYRLACVIRRFFFAGSCLNPIFMLYLSLHVPSH